MTEPQKRPNKKRVFSQAFDHRGLKFLATVNCYSSGRTAELVLKSGVSDDAIGHWDAAVVAKMAQHFGAGAAVIHALEYLGERQSQYCEAESGCWQ
jgi:hypothetical protein